MKIALTSLYLPSGSKIGVGYQVHYLANALVRRGHDVTVFSQTGASPDTTYKVAVIPPRKRLRTFGFAWDLRKVDFTGFDVLNAHGDDWFLWGTRKSRLVHTFHGSCLAEAIHARGLREKARMAMLAACEFNSCALADSLVTVSANTRRYIPFVRQVIPCGVDTEMFRPGGDKSAHPTLLFVGTMHGRKRGRMLLEMFQKTIRSRVRGAEFWAVCEEKIEGDGVRWFGRIPTPELAELFRQAWVFCLPSTYEGFGVPYVEAMSAGTPVVASPNPGAVEVTRGGQDGLIPRDAELAQTLLQVLTDAPLRDRLRQAGLIRAQNFSWNTVCARYETVYSGGRVDGPAPSPAVLGTLVPEGGAR